MTLLRAAVFFSLLSLLSGCITSTTSPYFKNDDKRAYALLGKNTAVFFGGQKRVVTIKPGFNSTYETDDYDNIVFVPLDSSKKQFVMQATKKTTNKTYYVAFNDYGPIRSSSAAIYEKGLPLYSAMDADGKKIKIVDLMRNPESELQKMSRAIIIKFDGISANTNEERILVYNLDNKYQVIKMQTLEEKFQIANSPETKQFEKWENQIKAQILRDGLRPGCQVMISSFNAIGATDVFSARFENGGCVIRDFIGDAFRFEIGKIYLKKCNNKGCEFEADQICQGRGGSFVDHCGEEMRKNPAYRGEAILSNGFMRIETIDKLNQ